MPYSLNDPRRPTTTTAALSALNTPSSTLCFHARNIPGISIEAYLLRILKYCPTTNDVFLSLLVYFDRMSRVGMTGTFPEEPSLSGPGEADGTPRSQPPAHTAGTSSPAFAAARNNRPENGDTAKEPRGFFAGMQGFAIDSYNVHRLVIAGITVASKFFSDVFYTNARYAKVRL